MSVISNNDIARAIYLVSKDKSHSEQADALRRVVKFLFRRRLFSKAPDILSRLKKIINEKEGKIIVNVSSAQKLNHQIKTHLEHSLKKRYGAKEVILEESLDEKLLGGFKVKVNNEIIDLSIRNKIEKLQEHLTKPV